MIAKGKYALGKHLEVCSDGLSEGQLKFRPSIVATEEDGEKRNKIKNDELDKLKKKNTTIMNTLGKRQRNRESLAQQEQENL